MPSSMSVWSSAAATTPCRQALHLRSGLGQAKRASGPHPGTNPADDPYASVPVEGAGAAEGVGAVGGAAGAGDARLENRDAGGRSRRRRGEIYVGVAGDAEGPGSALTGAVLKHQRNP